MNLVVVEVMALATGNKADYRHFYKLLLVGDSGVGKSCLLTRFADSTFNEWRTSTIGVDFKMRTVEIDDTRIKLQVWDSAGQERFRTVSGAYYRGAHGIGVVFDVTNAKSFRNLESWWLKEMEKNNCGEVPRVLIGTKCDLVDARKVRRDEVELFSRKHGMQYIETSSKTAERVSEAFMAIAREVHEER